MNKIGFLAPNGDFIECESWEHMSFALDLVEKMKDAPDKAKFNGLTAEEYLQELGYIVVRASDVYGLMGRIVDDRGHRLHMTDIQIKWLEDNYDYFPKDKQESVDDLFYWDGHNHAKRN